MRKAKKKTKQAAGTATQMLAGLLTGGLCGYLLIYYLTPQLEQATLGSLLLILAGLLVCLYLFALVHIAAHEAGHLLGGLLTGYRFSSFRIGSLMLFRQQGKLQLKRLHIAGTGGQCLMSPPELINGACPVFLYNLGGPLMNLLLSLLSWLLSLVLQPSLAVLALRLFALLGLFMGLTNGIPARVGGVDNDGYNALSLRKDPSAMQAFWIQMKIAEQSARGIRLKDMPADWFAPPAPAAMQNNLVVTLAVFACNRLMDELRLTEAAQAIDTLLDRPSGMMGLHRNLLQCDRLFCELAGPQDPDVLGRLHTRELQKFMKSMGRYPSVLRTQYAWAKCMEKDLQTAEKILQQFEQAAEKHPYPSDIAGERELLALIV